MMNAVNFRMNGYAVLCDESPVRGKMWFIQKLDGMCVDTEDYVGVSGQRHRHHAVWFNNFDVMIFFDNQVFETYREAAKYLKKVAIN